MIIRRQKNRVAQPTLIRLIMLCKFLSPTLSLSVLPSQAIQDEHDQTRLRHSMTTMFEQQVRLFPFKSLLALCYVLRFTMRDMKRKNFLSLCLFVFHQLSIITRELHLRFSNLFSGLFPHILRMDAAFISQVFPIDSCWCGQRLHRRIIN